MTKAPTPTEKSKKQSDNTKNATKTSITHRLRTDLGRSVGLVGWLFLINVDLAIFQPYLDLEAGDNQSLKIQVARRGIEPTVLLLRKPRA